jgi:hypothetical protein
MARSKHWEYEYSDEAAAQEAVHGIEKLYVRNIC